MSINGIGTVNTGIPAINLLVNLGIIVINIFIWIFNAFLVLLRLLWLLLINLHWVVLLVSLWYFGALWLPHHKPITEAVEVVWRCTWFPIWIEDVRPLLEIIVDGLNEILCWWNAAGQLVRLFRAKTINKLIKQCAAGLDLYRLFFLGFELVRILLVNTLTWLFLGNALENSYPTQPFLFALCDFIEDISTVLSCLCGDLRPIFDWLERIFTSENLKCGLHQLFNAFISIIQLAFIFLIDVLRLILAVVFTGAGVSGIRDAFAGEDGESIIPSTTVPLERFSATAVYTGEFLNDILQISICTVVSEVDSMGNETLIPDLYEQCLQLPTTRVDVFCILGPIVGGITRFIRLIIQLVFNIGRIGREFFTLPDGPRFLTDVWALDIFWDTMRDPPLQFNYTEFINNPPPVPGSNTSSIEQPNPALYGNYTIPIDITCNSTNTSITIIPCTECDRVQDLSIEDCLCRTAADLDEVVEPLIGFNLFDSTLCCILGKLIRVAVAFIKFAVDFIIHIIVIDRLPDFVTDQNNWETPFTELVGRPEELGGLLGCCRKLFDDIDERLKCICDIGVLLIKVVVELIRIVVIAIVRILNDIFATGQPGYFDYVCLSTENCMDLEVAVFSYLRRPRVKEEFTVDFDYIPISETAIPAWLDCFCELFNFAFINQFLPDPLDPLPDIWCGVDFFLRAAIELVKFIAQFVLSILETFATIFDPDRPFTLIFIQYLACDSETLCSNIPELISDLEDFVQCPCDFIEAIDDLINPMVLDIPCICDLLNGIAIGAVELLRALAVGAGAIIKLLDCIGTGFPEPECSDDLADRFKNFFEQLIIAIETVSLTFGGLGCVLGNIFQFDCLGTTFFIPPDYVTCTGGSGPGICAPADRLTRVFVDLFRLFAVILIFPINLLKNLVALAFDLFGLTTLPISFSELLRDFLLTIGEPLFGDESEDPPTSGLFQSVGLLLNCMVGPPSDECKAELDPAGGECFGDIFYVVGVNIRKVYTAFVNFITSFIGIIEALLGSPSTLGQKIIDFITAFFDLIATILGSLQDVIDIVISVVVSIIRFIFGDGVGDLFEFVLGVLSSIASVVIGLVDFLLGFFSAFLKRDITGVFNSQRTHQIITLNDLPKDTLKTFSKLTNEDITALTDTETILTLMTKGTYCYKVINTLKDKLSFDEMSLFEEGAWKACYMAYGFPILFNSMDLPIDLPLDFVYNIDTWLKTTSDVLKVIKYYFEMRRQQPGNMSTIFVDIERVEDIPTVDVSSSSSSSSSAGKRTLVEEVHEDIKNAEYITTVISDKDNLSMNVPIINGECPIIHQHKTFKEFIHSKGIYCKLAEDIIDAYESMEKTQMERNYLKISSVMQYGGILHQQQLLSSTDDEDTASKFKGEFKRAYLPMFGLKKQMKKDNEHYYHQTTDSKELDEKFDNFDNSMTDLKKRFIEVSNELPSNWQDRLYNYRTKVLGNTLTSTIKRFAGTYTHHNRARNNTRFNNNNEDNNNNGKTLRKTKIQEKYGHILKGKSLIGHRFGMIRAAFNNIWKKHTDKITVGLWKNANAKYGGYIREKHRETFKRGKIPTISKAYRSYTYLRGMHWSFGKILPAPPGFIHTVLTGHVYKHETIDESGIISVSAHNPPPLDLCITFDDQLTCSNCDSCDSGSCAGCSSCVNCTDLGNGTSTCDRCSLCSLEGENLCNDCVGCSNCEIDQVCLNCTIIEYFVTKAVDIVDFCHQKNTLNNSDVIRLPPENSTLITIVPIPGPNDTSTFTGDVFTTWINNLVNNIVGFDLIATILEFFLNFNVDPFDGPVGILYFATKRLPFKIFGFGGKCERDVDLQCTFGVGLEQAIIISTITSLILGFAIWIIVPQFAGIFSAGVSLFCTGGILCFWLYFTVSLAWFFNPVCLQTPGSSILSFFLPATPPLPMIPECAPQEIFDLLDKIIQECYQFLLDFIPGVNGICPICPDRMVVTDCRTLGFTGYGPHLSYLFQAYLSGFTDYILNTTIGRDFCLFGTVLFTNPLGEFLTIEFDLENNREELDKCFFFVISNLFSFIVILIVGIILIAVLIPLIISFISIVILPIFKIPPFSLLLPWNITGGASGTDATVSDAYSDTGSATAFIGSSMGSSTGGVSINDIGEQQFISPSLHSRYYFDNGSDDDNYGYNDDDDNEYKNNDKGKNKENKKKKYSQNKRRQQQRQQRRQFTPGSSYPSPQQLPGQPFVNDMGNTVYITEQQRVQSPFIRRRSRYQQTSTSGIIFTWIGSFFDNFIERLTANNNNNTNYQTRGNKYKIY